MPRVDQTFVCILTNTISNPKRYISSSLFYSEETEAQKG